ncbi:hypothetical protein [Streptomyces sp. NPDC058426]
MPSTTTFAWAVRLSSARLTIVMPMRVRSTSFAEKLTELTG